MEAWCAALLRVTVKTKLTPTPLIRFHCFICHCEGKMTEVYDTYSYSDYDESETATPFDTGTSTDYNYDDNTDGMGQMCDRSSVRNFRALYEPPLYSLIFVLGLFGNLLVVFIFLTVKNRLKTMTDMYLLNLAVADLLFLFTLPFWATDALSGWSFGDGLCKVVMALYKINFFSSMLLLTCISVDRYVAIVHVTEAHNQSKRTRLLQAKLACLSVWLFSFFLAMPEFVFASVKSPSSGRPFCTMVYWSNEQNRTKILVLALQICMGFCLPLLVMACCYAVIIQKLLQARNFEKHKALRVIFAVVAVFVLSQLPYNAHLVVEAGQASNATMVECDTLREFDVIGQVVKSLAYTHCCLNPFLYVFIGVRFRKDLRKVLHKVTCRLLTPPTPKPNRPSLMSADTDTTPALSL
ncbi:C-C chemokine receptor type 9-like [Engraulis encrasicolus]|uniref:C-C chemokine receptor type 9-like n=1 Tax=Engraulis encrasicolus TaxID=184585 RepID=UPI002FD3A482